MTYYDLAQRSVLRTLLDAHPRLLDVGELDDWLPDIPRVTRSGITTRSLDGL